MCVLSLGDSHFVGGFEGGGISLNIKIEGTKLELVYKMQTLKVYIM